MFRMKRIWTYKAKLHITPEKAGYVDSVAAARAESEIIERSRVWLCQRAVPVFEAIIDSMHVFEGLVDTGSAYSILVRSAIRKTPVSPLFNLIKNLAPDRVGVGGASVNWKVTSICCSSLLVLK